MNQPVRFCRDQYDLSNDEMRNIGLSYFTQLSFISNHQGNRNTGCMCIGYMMPVNNEQLLDQPYICCKNLSAYCSTKRSISAAVCSTNSSAIASLMLIKERHSIEERISDADGTALT